MIPMNYMVTISSSNNLVIQKEEGVSKLVSYIFSKGKDCIQNYDIIIELSN